MLGRLLDWSWIPGVAVGLCLMGSCGGSGGDADTALPDAHAPVGLAAVIDLSSLPELRPPGTQVLQVSSYDRNGNNSDFGISAEDAQATFGVPFRLDNSFLYRDGERYVLFDELGPGVVSRIWMTDFAAARGGGLSGDITFELDDEATPRLQWLRNDLFSGNLAPFLAPLAGDKSVSSGGFYSVLPLVYARRLRITSSTIPNYLNITHTRLPRDHPAVSFDPRSDTQPTAAVLAATGRDPKGTRPTRTIDVEVDLEVDAEQVLWDHRGSGTVLRFEVTGPDGAEIPVGLRLQAYWDGAARPQVDAPLDDFFGAALGPAARSLAFGRSGDRFYSYFPMPFQERARILLLNTGATAVRGWHVRVSVADRVMVNGRTHFWAQANASHLAQQSPDYVLLETTGTGHVVGLVMTAGCAESGACRRLPASEVDTTHLEGDERVAVDGSRYAPIHGTGLEDFFNAGLYFLHGPFTLPTHGTAAIVRESKRRPGYGVVSAYRLLLADAIPFAQDIRMTLEHGPQSDTAAEFSSLVFYYAIPEASLTETDHLVLGSNASELAHDLRAEGRVDTMVSSGFRGDRGASRMTAAGFTASVTRFRMKVDPTNRGVRLRRLADIRRGRQTGLVRVDGKPVGVWATADINPFLRWAELDFEIPASFSAGREHLEVEIDARDSPTPWTASAYAVFSHLAVPGRGVGRTQHH